MEIGSLISELGDSGRKKSTYYIIIKFYRIGLMTKNQKEKHGSRPLRID